MRALFVLSLLAVVTFVPTLADAHQCAGSDCGNCVKGDVHQHADGQRACQSDATSLQDAGYNGARSTPGVGLLALLVLAGVALLRR